MWHCIEQIAAERFVFAKSESEASSWLSIGREAHRESERKSQMLQTGTPVRWYGDDQVTTAFPGNRPADVERLNSAARANGFAETAQLGGEPQTGTVLGYALPYRRGWGGPFVRVQRDSDGREMVCRECALEIVPEENRA